MAQLPEKLDLQHFWKWLEEEMKMGDNAKSMVEKVLSSADDDFENKIRLIVNDVSTKVLSGYLSLPVCLSGWLATCLCLPVCLSGYLSLSVCLATCLRLSVWLPVSACLSV